MADLSVLIRLHRHELDEKRRVLGELYSAMATLERQKRALDREFEVEKQAVTEGKGDVHFTFASFTERTAQRRKDIEKQEAEIEKQIERARDGLMETFAELKKYEMTQEERERIEEEERAFRESRELDAIGIEGFRRKSGDETS
jgi:flagellar export protein FliJ